MLEWIKIIGALLISWPLAAMVILLIVRKPLIAILNRFVESSVSKAELGPLKMEFTQFTKEGKNAVDRFNRITELMAESRLLELEITHQRFDSFFTEEQSNRMQMQIKELKKLTSSE